MLEIKKICPYVCRLPTGALKWALRHEQSSVRFTVVVRSGVLS
jgi:hypothetical protein